MPRMPRNAGDRDLQRYRDALAPYATDHPKAKVECQRWHNSIVNVRIIDPDFQGLAWDDRDKNVWKLLEPLGDDLLNQLYLLILVTPKESKTRGSSLEFDNPPEYALK